jgi:hypothetical protein
MKHRDVSVFMKGVSSIKKQSQFINVGETFKYKIHGNFKLSHAKRYVPQTLRPMKVGWFRKQRLTCL